MLRLPGSALSQPTTLGLRHRLTTQRVLTRESRLFESLFDVRERARRRRRALSRGNLTGEPDHESQTVLQIMELRLGYEPCPVEIGILPDDPRERFAEPYLEHPRELEAAVVGNSRAGLEVFGPGEVVPGGEFYDYVAKYRSTESRTVVAPALDPGIRDDVRRMAGEAFVAIGAAGFARVDFLLAADELLFISEINTIPGFTPISLFPMLCAEGGYAFGDICERIVELAAERAAVEPVRRLTRADLP